MVVDLGRHCALVTGASGTIGGGIAVRLADAGASVVAHYHSGEEPIARLIQRISDRSGACEAVQADLTSPADVETMFGSLERRGIVPDIVVNNAGLQPVTALAELAHRKWREVIETNLDSAFLVTQFAARAMSRRGLQGSVINIASIEGSDPAAGHAHYSASKAALIMFTRSAALEYGRAGIRVNSVSPGLIDRNGLARDWPDGVSRWTGASPLGRLGSVEDVANAVLFLASDGAGWISGIDLIVDGGMSAKCRW